MATSKWFWRMTLSILALYVVVISTKEAHGYPREICEHQKTKLVRPPSDFRNRLRAVREQMKTRATLQGPEIDAYILPSTDEHLNQEVAQRDRRLTYLTGFTGIKGFAAITHNGAAIWVEQRYAEQANRELDCDWHIFITNGPVTITDWLRSQLPLNKRIGADPHLVPHYLWLLWEADLKNHFLKLVKVNTNFIDLIWGLNRPAPEENMIQVQGRNIAGATWEEKIEELRRYLKNFGCDAMVVTSLTEIAYILNIRGNDVPYTPVVKSYLIVSEGDIFFYVDRSKMNLETDLHLATDCFKEKCVNVREYRQIWNDIRTYSQLWRRVLVPSPCVQELGASEAIYSSMPEKIVFDHVSPIIFMRAQKNVAEQNGMRNAHIKDGAAICEAMSNLETRFYSEKWSEDKIKYEIDRARLSQKHAKGLSLRTVVAFGEHSAQPYYISSNVTNIEVSDQSLLIIESGSQYLEGTTDVSRTFIFGEPTVEMKQIYTNVLIGILRLAQLKFPSGLKHSEVDTLVRSEVWNKMSEAINQGNYLSNDTRTISSLPYLNYPYSTGHGIGVYGAVEEPPVFISYGSGSQYNFKEGYFLSSESGFYKLNEFGVRLKNVLEVTDTHRVLSSGEQFLAFQDVTLVPYEPKLIDGTLMSAPEKKWFNEYNTKIRNLIGEELKRQGNMQAFYWMMNKTRHIREYLPEEEYRATNSVKGDSLKDFHLKSVLFMQGLVAVKLYTFLYL